MKIALFRNMEFGFNSPVDVNDHNIDGFAGYVRISEVVEVDLPLLKNDTVINNQVAVLDEMIKSHMAESELKLNELKRRKQDLLAITHQESN